MLSNRAIRLFIVKIAPHRSAHFRQIFQNHNFPAIKLLVSIGIYYSRLIKSCVSFAQKLELQ